ncbi:flagellar biosynthetic protein FliO [Isosphaeraceae bacterium EP7]
MHLRRPAGPPATPRAVAARLVLLTWLVCVGISTPAKAVEPPATLALPSTARDHEPAGRIPRTNKGARGSVAEPASSGFWWLGTAGVGLALAAFGWASLAARGYRPGGDPATLRVLGRTSLGSKQAVSLVQVGDRILIVGTGAQGAPSLLGEIDDADEIGRLAGVGRRPAVTPLLASTRAATLATRDARRGEGA